MTMCDTSQLREFFLFIYFMIHLPLKIASVTVILFIKSVSYMDGKKSWSWLYEVLNWYWKSFTRA